MSEELYNSSDYCSLAEQYEELKKENAELTADKIHLIQAAMDGGDRYHYTAHDIGYRDLERKVKALEVDYIISNRELLILQVELARRDADIVTLNNRLTDAVTLNSELVEKVESRDEKIAELRSDITGYRRTVVSQKKIIARLKEDGERLAARPYPFIDVEHVESGTYCHYCHKSNKFDHTPDCPITLHCALMKELEND